MQEKGHVISVLNKVEKALVEGDVASLRELSNQTIHSASIFQDPDSIAIAITIYALSKIVERPNYKELEGYETFLTNSQKRFSKAAENLENGRFEAFRKNLKAIRRGADKIYGKLKIYIREVFRKAMINKASKIYEHGLSAEETASLLGITQWELNDYIGKTEAAESKYIKSTKIKERINRALEVLEG